METNLLIFLAAAALCIVLIAKLAHRLMATGSTNSSDESQKGGRSQMSGYEPSSPSEGNAKEMAEAGSFVDFLLNSHEKLGDMFYFYMGTRKYISIASPELMKQMAGIFDRDGMLFSTFRPLIGDQSIQFANGEEGRKRRQLQDRSYSHTAVMKGIPLFQQEAMSIVNKWSTLPEGEHVALTDAFYMFALKVQYLHAVIDESMRLSRIAPFAARCPDYDFKLGDYDIPANTPVVQCLGAVLHNKRIFKNPKEFNPDRFMPDQKQQLPPYAYEPFGFAGKRKCPGYRLSLTETQVFLITLLEHLQVSLVPGQTVESDFGLVTRPKAEIWITVSKAE